MTCELIDGIGQFVGFSKKLNGLTLLKEFLMGKLLNKASLTGIGVAVGAAFAVQPAVAQTVSDDGQGSAIVVPYYTVNDGWRTLVNLTNTSENSIVVKFRLHESRNSRDVLDFNIALSPRDVWTATIQESANGRPELVTTDRSCTIPLSVRDNGATASELAYSNEFVDHTGSNGDVMRTREGYIKVLVMGETDGSGRAPGSVSANFPGDIAYDAEHVAGEPRNCGRVNNSFSARSADFDTTTAFATVPGMDDAVASTAFPAVDDGADVQTGSGSPLARLGSVDAQGNNESAIGYGPIATGNPLKANVSLVNTNTGRAAGVTSLHIEGYGVGQNFVTAQEFPWFLEPTIASSNALWTLDGVNALIAGISATQIKNEWSSNANTGARSEWIVNFPTKRFEDDVDEDNIQAACSAWRNTLAGSGVADTTGITQAMNDFGDNDTGGVCAPELFGSGTFQDGDNGIAPIVVNYDIFDREEGGVQVALDGPVVSPAPPPEVTIDNLPYEVNVVKIGRDVNDVASVLGSPVARAVETNELQSNANSGWLLATFDGNSADAPGSNSDAVPVISGIYKQRDFGDAALNFGQYLDAAYTRPTP